MGHIAKRSDVRYRAADRSAFHQRVRNERDKLIPEEQALIDQHIATHGVTQCAPSGSAADQTRTEQRDTAIKAAMSKASKKGAARRAQGREKDRLRKELAANRS